MFTNNPQLILISHDINLTWFKFDCPYLAESLLLGEPFSVYTAFLLNACFGIL